MSAYREMMLDELRPTLTERAGNMQKSYQFFDTKRLC